MSTPRQFSERAELLDFLLEVATATSETLDLDSLLSSVADLVRQVIAHEIFAILLYSDRAQGLCIRYARGHRQEIVKNLIIPLGEGITGLAAATRQPILANDVRSDPRYLPAVDAVRSELAVPMVARNKLVGVIDVQSAALNAFTEEDRALLQLLGSRVVSSIENARLHKRVITQSKTWRILTHLARDFSSTLHADELLLKIARGTRQLITYDAFNIFLVDGENKVLRNRFSQRYDKRIAADNIPLGRGITGATVAGREPIRVDDTTADPRYIAIHPEVRSEVAVPLIVQDRVIGVMDLESERLGAFTDEHVRTLSLIAPQIATSLENARLYGEVAQRERRMQEDLAAARNVQSLLLPRTAPDVEGLDIAIGVRPAREITGDLYDFFEQQDFAIIAFGDSSGKGAAAALYGALVSGLLRSMGRRRRSPSELLKQLNDTLLERRVEAQYVTLLLIDWECRTRRMKIANAGALPPLVCRGGTNVRTRIEGVPLGLLEHREYDEIELKLHRGDVLLLYSDGVPDQLSPTGEDYGTARLFRAVHRACEKSAQDVVDQVYADLDDFAGGRRRGDDQTIIAMKVV